MNDLLANYITFKSFLHPQAIFNFYLRILKLVLSCEKQLIIQKKNRSNVCQDTMTFLSHNELVDRADRWARHKQVD